ncbi:MAG: hemin uptake protein HemP [Pirellulaceae bacterium]|nr:hemin uptake protein HemP [Pirellulaceae bacterium]
MNDKDRPQPTPPEPEIGISQRTYRVFQAEELFQGDKEIFIRFGEANYRLKKTKSGKLLLTK